eukprot:346729-Chlamydomonas_euryale.AAC.1
MPRGGHPMCGLWIGTYGVHGMEFVTVGFDPGRGGGGGGGGGGNAPGVLTATKVTGDYHVPSGQLSFRIQLGDFGAPFATDMLPPSPGGEPAEVGFAWRSSAAGGSETLLGRPGQLLELPPDYTSRVNLKGHRLRIR